MRDDECEYEWEWGLEKVSKKAFDGHPTMMIGELQEGDGMDGIEESDSAQEDELWLVDRDHKIFCSSLSFLEILGFFLLEKSSYENCHHLIGNLHFLKNRFKTSNLLQELENSIFEDQFLIVLTVFFFFHCSLLSLFVVIVEPFEGWISADFTLKIINLIGYPFIIIIWHKQSLNRLNTSWFYHFIFHLSVVFRFNNQSVYFQTAYSLSVTAALHTKSVKGLN